MTLVSPIKPKKPVSNRPNREDLGIDLGTSLKVQSTSEALLNIALSIIGITSVLCFITAFIVGVIGLIGCYG